MWKNKNKKVESLEIIVSRYWVYVPKSKISDHINEIM